MNDDVKELIKYVCSNDVVRAKEKAKIMLLKDNTQKDRIFCERMIAQMETKKDFLELPSNISGLLTMEDVSESFNNKRYFLSERELKALGRILKISKVSDALLEKGICYVNYHRP